MNRKAFTLIELLGVITILGLISLLVAPTIINQIRNSKGKIDEVTEKLIYSATDLYLDSKQSEFPKTNGSTYCVTLQKLVDDGKLNSPVLDASGNEISLEKNVKVDILNNSYNYSMPSTCEMKLIYANGIMSSKDNCINTGICENGTLVSVQVNDTETYNFYVINDENDELKLIMDSNLGDNVVWDTSSSNTNGPLWALEELATRTNTWVNVHARRYVISDDGGYEKYGNIIRTMKATLPTKTELLDIKTENNGIVPSYLYENLRIDNNSSLPCGYWTSAAHINDIYSFAFSCRGGNNCSVFEFKVSVVNNENDFMNFLNGGIRPVITLTK